MLWLEPDQALNIGSGGRIHPKIWGANSVQNVLRTVMKTPQPFCSTSVTAGNGFKWCVQSSEKAVQRLADHLRTMGANSLSGCLAWSWRR